MFYGCLFFSIVQFTEAFLKLFVSSYELSPQWNVLKETHSDTSLNRNDICGKFKNLFSKFDHFTFIIL